MPGSVTQFQRKITSFTYLAKSGNFEPAHIGIRLAALPKYNPNDYKNYNSA